MKQLLGISFCPYVIFSSDGMMGLKVNHLCVFPYFNSFLSFFSLLIAIVGLNGCHTFSFHLDRAWVAWVR